MRRASGRAGRGRACAVRARGGMVRQVPAVGPWLPLATCLGPQWRSAWPRGSCERQCLERLPELLGTRPSTRERPPAVAYVRAPGPRDGQHEEGSDEKRGREGKKISESWGDNSAELRVRCGESGRTSTPDLEVDRGIECRCARLSPPLLCLQLRGPARLPAEVEEPSSPTSGPHLTAVLLLACALSTANLALGACEAQALRCLLSAGSGGALRCDSHGATLHRLGVLEMRSMGEE